MRHPMTFGVLFGTLIGANVELFNGENPWSLAVAVVLLPLAFLFDRKAKAKGKI